MSKHHYWGALAIGLFLTGCSSEDLIQQGPQETNINVDRTYYVNLNIRGDMGGATRAADNNNGKPVDGTDFEDGQSDINNAYMVFYDATGTMVGEIVTINLNKDAINMNPAEGEDPVYIGTASGATGTTVDKYYQAVVPISVRKGEGDPAQVICYLNPITPASLQNPLDVIQTNTRDILCDENETYFAMSNSVYYPKDGENQQQEPQIAVPISKDDGQLFDTMDQAKEALKEASMSTATEAQKKKVVNIYVERYATKLKFGSVTPNSYEGATSQINNADEIPVTLNFVLDKWALNAACHETYVVKSFRQESTQGQILPENYTYDDLNKRINASSFTIPTTGENPGSPVYNPILATPDCWEWNAPGYHRSYWAMSPAYFTNRYPEVSQDIVDWRAQAGGNNDALQQHYWSYTELVTDGKGYDVESFSNATSRYFHETTVGAKALGSANPAAAVASVILVGHYDVKVDGTSLPENTTFYTYLTGNNGKALVYFEADPTSLEGASAIQNGESMLRRFIEQTSILFKNVGTDTNPSYVPYDITNEDDLKTLVAALYIASPYESLGTTTAGGETVLPDPIKDMKIAERYRTLQFKETADVTNIYVATTDGYKGIGTDNGKISMGDANIALMNQVGYCVKYNLGEAYFNIPVKHYGWYRAGNAQKDAEKINWNNVRIGDFGMVRNHSYQVQVNKIEGLATGIGNPTSPIVPPADTNDYFVAYRVNILNWAVVPVQNVNL